ncbi:MAG: hypothetical protein J5J00_11965 [Deltaproteobacteria bacterium]|nr:hypothetical protein [Deltaproteobacteria bacterium]
MQSNILNAIVPDKSRTAAELQQLSKVISLSNSLESLIFNAIHNHYSLQICSVPLENDNVSLCIEVLNDRVLEKKGRVATIFIPLSQLSKKQRSYSLAGKYSQLADMPNYYPLPDWYEKRNKKLRIREFGEHGELICGAVGMTELILTYALNDFGIVEIKKDMIEDVWNKPYDCARLTLSYLGDEDIAGWSEKIYVLMKRLARLLKQDTAGLCG